MEGTFLEPNEIKTLTGRSHRDLQIEVLKANGIPFFLNGLGRPVVARAAIVGRGITVSSQPKKSWVPKVLKAG